MSNFPTIQAEGLAKQSISEILHAAPEKWTDYLKGVSSSQELRW